MKFRKRKESGRFTGLFPFVGLCLVSPASGGHFMLLVPAEAWRYIWNQSLSSFGFRPGNIRNTSLRAFSSTDSSMFAFKRL